jgi:soluble lytic murein transglycosylase
MSSRSRKKERARRIVIIGGIVAISIAVLAGLVGLIVCLTISGSRVERWRGLAELYGETNGLDPGLVLAVIQAESAGDPHAVSRTGARGLMQLMPATADEVARRLGVRLWGHSDLFNPDINVRLGTAYLAQLRRMFGDDPHLYIAAYNAGPGRIQRLRNQNPELSSEEIIARFAPEETRTYVPRVLRYWAKWRRWLAQSRERSR